MYPANTLDVVVTGNDDRNLTTDIRLQIHPGERLALIGENGSGKTSLLRVIAGLDRARTGSRVATGTEVLTDTRTHVPVHQRHIAMVFPQPRLSGHLTVRDNLRLVTGRRHLANQHTEQITALLDRKAHTLSSGEGAIVAVVRALTAAPRALLLDEPFSALDTAAAGSARAAVRHYLSASHAPMIIATHSALDVAALATHVAIIADGRIIDSGRVHAMAARPASTFAATFFGLNLWPVAAQGNIAVAADQRQVRLATTCHGDAWLSFAASAVTVSTQQPMGSARNAWRGTITHIDHLGTTVRLHIDDILHADVTPSSVLELGLAEGVEVWASVKATQIEVYAR